MSTADVEAIKKELGDINVFVRERFDPVTSEVGLLREDTERIGRDIAQLQERERAVRRDALSRYVDEHGTPDVSEGPYAGLDVLDLGLLRRLARSQRRESFGTAWLERTEDAKRTFVARITPAGIQESGELASRKLSDWYTVDRKPHRPV